MGIDYGHGNTNIDTKTGIRYGVISQRDVGDAWYDESEAFYGSSHCPECGDELDDDTLDEYECECGHEIKWVGEECYGDEVISHYIDNGEYSAECGDSGDIFIYRSPYYTNCGFCSPCAPGAGYLTDNGDDCKAYCFGPEWFDGDPPHAIYQISDNSLVYEGRYDGNG